MTETNLIQLAQTTLNTPRLAARQIIALALPRNVLWMALALVAAVSTIISHLFNTLVPPATEGQLPSYLNAPMTVFVLSMGLMVVYVHTIYWSGGAMGGKGSLFDVLALFVWLQILGTVAMLGVFVLTLLAPAFGGLLSLVIFGLFLWILAHFVTEAMSLPSTGHGVMTLLIAIIGLAMGLGIMLALLGISAEGILNNV